MRITAGELERLLAGLDGVGRRPDGFHRLAWTDEMAEAEAWFTAHADHLALHVERDPAGNLWALPEGTGPWWGIGSHLDTVRAGGRYDGALGVATALAVAARATVPLAVVCFADEEGARFNTPTWGSRALTGVLDLGDVLERRDADGIVLADALRVRGIDPDRVEDAQGALRHLRGFLEVHIDQTTDLARASAPVGVVSSLAARLRLALSFAGAADHAGTTVSGERRDALLAAARVIVRGDELAASDRGLVATTARMEIDPNALTTVPAAVRMWMDARAADPEAVLAWERDLARAAREIAAAGRVEFDLVRASFSAGTAFSVELRERAAAAARDLGLRLPVLTSFAGHDAGLLAARIPAGMLFVRNPTGVSHSGDEAVDLDDAAVAASLALATLEGVA